MPSEQATDPKSTNLLNVDEPPADLSDPYNDTSKTPIIEFTHVTKTYYLYKNDRTRLFSLLDPRKNRTQIAAINANNDLSFQIMRGESVAFIGRNGAGKTTALKIIAGVTYPTSGEVFVRGRVNALLGLTTGFDGGLTGRENISLRGQIVGLSQKQIRSLEESIIDFAELGLYIDQPLRTYSSGMKSRLGFAFAVATNPEILIVDEALSVGDRRFQNKCLERIREIMSNEDTTVLFVTHASAAAKEFCTRGIVLNEGVKVFDGAINDAVAYYDSQCQ